MPSKKLFLVNAVLFVSVSLLLVGFVGASSEMWSQTYGGASADSAEAMVQTSDGGYAIAGGSLLVKTDEYGNMEWNQSIGGVVHSLVATSDGGYALAGGINGDFWLAKADEHGVIPEFPSWIILPLFLTAALTAIIYRRKLTKK